jgi:hypothetical protein
MTAEGDRKGPFGPARGGVGVVETGIDFVQLSTGTAGLRRHSPLGPPGVGNRHPGPPRPAG